MARIIFSFIMAIHGIIHLMGFAEAWKLGPDGKLSDKTLLPFSENALKTVGIFWLATCLLLIAATVLYYMKKDWFWIAAVTGVVFSQTLIILYWHDAKWGTIVNVIVLVVTILSIGSFYYKRMVRADVLRLRQNAARETILVSKEKVQKLPMIIHTWLTNSHIVDQELPNIIDVTQSGSMRTDAESKWMPFNAAQCFSIDPPGFVWDARIHSAFFIDINGRDKYEDGKGNMLIKAASLFPIANERGMEVDQGTMIRFMAEMIWFPQAAVSEYLVWEQLTEHSARVTMRYKGVSASGIYTFNTHGLPIAFEAERFYRSNGSYSMQTWSVASTRYGYFNGIPVANASEVTWKLKDGDLTWLKLEIISID